jgi:hypothetical protein
MYGYTDSQIAIRGESTRFGGVEADLGRNLVIGEPPSILYILEMADSLLRKICDFIELWKKALHSDESDCSIDRLLIGWTDLIFMRLVLCNSWILSRVTTAACRRSKSRFIIRWR